MRDVASIGLLKLEKLTTGIHPCWDQWLDVLARKSAMSNKGIILEIPAFATDIPPLHLLVRSCSIARRRMARRGDCDLIKVSHVSESICR